MSRGIILNAETIGEPGTPVSRASVVVVYSSRNVGVLSAPPPSGVDFSLNSRWVFKSARRAHRAPAVAMPDFSRVLDTSMGSGAGRHLRVW